MINKDIFEDAREMLNCDYISDLARLNDAEKTHLIRVMKLEQCPSDQVRDLICYLFH